MFIPKHGGDKNIRFICARTDDKANIIQNKNRGNLRLEIFLMKLCQIVYYGEKKKYFDKQK